MQHMKIQTTLVILVGWMAWSSTAQADMEFGAGARLAVPTGDFSSAVDMGYGIEGYVGYGFDMPLLHIRPELRVAYTEFDEERSGMPSVGAWRFLGGAKVALGEIVRPFVDAHLGYSIYSPSGFDDEGSITMDMGAGLDITILPVMDIGGGIGYNLMWPGGNDIGWFDFGVWVTFNF